MLSNREHLILLNLVPDVGSTRLRRLLDAFGSLERLWEANEREFRQVEGIGPTLAQRIVSGLHQEGLLEEELSRARREGVAILTLEDPGYPKALREISGPPLALYVRGVQPLFDEAAIAVVGSRNASLYGLQTAERLAYDLALRGITVVSGLARGIDGSAHRGALKAQGRTIAVLGSGISRIYPPEHEDMAKQVAASGAIISEYPIEMAPLAANFPRRNRIISGLSLGVVVVEAGARSGALITADLALEQGREVFAVPGAVTTVTSQGTHGLIKQGAKLVTCVEDILEELQLSTKAVKHPAASAQHKAHETLSELEQRILQGLNDQPRHIDTIAAEEGLPASHISAMLVRLELQGFVRQIPGKQFVRCDVYEGAMR